MVCKCLNFLPKREWARYSEPSVEFTRKPLSPRVIAPADSMSPEGEGYRDGKMAGQRQREN